MMEFLNLDLIPIISKKSYHLLNLSLDLKDHEWTRENFTMILFCELISCQSCLGLPLMSKTSVLLIKNSVSDRVGVE